MRQLTGTRKSPGEKIVKTLSGELRVSFCTQPERIPTTFSLALKSCVGFGCFDK
jgi:hypothetical protein